MAEVHDGPARVVLTASVARRYYIDGRSKVEIAAEFGLSRFKVARLLDAARESGLVRIEIRHQGEIDVDLSGRLQEGRAVKGGMSVKAQAILRALDTFRVLASMNPFDDIGSARISDSVRHAVSFRSINAEIDSPVSRVNRKSSSPVRNGCRNTVSSSLTRSAPAASSSTTNPPPTE